MDKQMRDFLTRILNEPGFRAHVQKDPGGALGTYKITENLANLPKPVRLPSDEEIRALLVLEKSWDHLKACYAWFVLCGWPKP